MTLLGLPVTSFALFVLGYALLRHVEDLRDLMNQNQWIGDQFIGSTGNLRALQASSLLYWLGRVSIVVMCVIVWRRGGFLYALGFLLLAIALSVALYFVVGLLVRPRERLHIVSLIAAPICVIAAFALA